MRIPRRTPPLILVLLAACSYSGVGPEDGREAAVEAALDAPFTLAPGETARITGTTLLVTFVGVSSDSRCPEDVTCFWEGDAAVEVESVLNGAPRSHVLHTSVRPGVRPGAVERAGFRIGLEAVEPGPRTDRPVPPAEYRATLRVTRLE